MMNDVISSASNPLAMRLKSLADAKGRKQSGAFLVEGEVMINEALSSGLKPIEALFERESELSLRLISMGARVSLCTRDVMLRVCDTKTPQGCCASFEMPRNAQIAPNAKLIIALDDVQDPGNVGTILRTADAAGFEGILLNTGCADIYAPKVQRAAMGSGFRMNCVKCDLPETLIKMRSQGCKIVVSALDGEDIYSAYMHPDRLILVIGNEARGVSEQIKLLSDIRLKIPMRGRAESLNASVAAGILMYELTRPRLTEIKA